MNRQSVSKFVIGLAALGFGGMVVPAQAQVTPFDLVGHIQSFCLDNQIFAGDCLSKTDKQLLADQEKAGNTTDSRRVDKASSKFIGARLVVNGIAVIIPSNLVIQFPAAYFTPQQVFAAAQGVSRKYQESGLALNDKIPPLAAFEVAVSGNIVGGRYIAGLVSISQQSLNASAGFIRVIDPNNTGMMCVGGNPTPATPPIPPAPLACDSGDTRVRLNDPKITDTSDAAVNDGRYGSQNSTPPDTEKPNPQPPPAPAFVDNPNSRFPDPRFTVDQGNPTIHALTGFPMCVPRSINATTQESTDLKCPVGNRPRDPVTNRFRTTFVMDDTALNPPANFGNVPVPACGTGSGQCDQKKQAPFVVGDYVTYAGTYAMDAIGEFVSVHTLVANVGIYTKPGVDPAYATLDESLIGTMGPLAICTAPPTAAASSAECQDRIKIEGFMTDPSRIDSIHVYALDYPVSGGSVSLTPQVRRLGPTPKDQAVFGRFRYITGKRALVLFDSTGIRGATRELMVRIDGTIPLADGTGVPPPPSTPVANGLNPGIYIAPIGEYIFPEPTGVQGGLPPPLNFECLAFLVNGWSLDGSTVIGRLTPWPGASVPSSVVCNQ